MDPFPLDLPLPGLATEFWPYLVVSLNLVVSLLTSGHVILHKRDTQAVIAWVGVIWLAPFLGALLYIGFGINRIERKASTLRGHRRYHTSNPANPHHATRLVQGQLRSDRLHLQALAKLVTGVTQLPLLPGNRIEALINGDQAYPAMLDAIEKATRSITLSSYIFNNDHAGRMFFDALHQAVRRGIEVRVIIDDVGSRYSWPSMAWYLSRAGIHVTQFIPTLIPWRFRYMNLRSHRKILVVDGELGFSGGMNICEENLLQTQPRNPAQDLHFRVHGPVVAHMQEVFATDWWFSSGELLEGETWFPPIEPMGEVLARGVPAGPDEDLDKLELTLLGGLACAQSSVLIVSPYFLPDTALSTALKVAAMRGIEIDIVLPQRNYLALVQWASTAILGQLLEHGCRIWFSPPPFEHTKLMVIDEAWTFFGSANWDARSLFLNFEFNLECYDAQLAEGLTQLVRSKINRSKRATLVELEGRSLPIKLRDGVTRLLSPYL